MQLDFLGAHSNEWWSVARLLRFDRSVGLPGVRERARVCQVRAVRCRCSARVWQTRSRVRTGWGWRLSGRHGWGSPIPFVCAMRSRMRRGFGVARERPALSEATWCRHLWCYANARAFVRCARSGVAVLLASGDQARVRDSTRGDGAVRTASDGTGGAGVDACAFRSTKAANTVAWVVVSNANNPRP